MVTLSDSDKRELEAAVSAAEARTSAEIVVAVVDMCDDYRLHTVPYAAVIGFVVFGALALFVPDLHVRMAFLVTGIVTLAVALALQWAPLRLLTVPRAARAEAAERLAHLEFAALVAGRTAAANGLLIFIALAEHHADIVPEPELARAVPQAVWQKIMDDLIVELKAGRTVEGVRAAITACGDAAALVFPRSGDDRDEIGNAPHMVQPR
jgi:putative membrane protein